MTFVRWALPTFAALALSAPGALAETSAKFAVPPSPAPGVDTVALADVGVPRPAGEPCVVTLFGPRQFAGVDPVAFDYAPPQACSGPWAKVVFEADFDVTAGRQFDRTAIIDIGGVNVYYGSTMEPRRTIAPAWRVERDVTDYAALLAKPSGGQALIANVVNETYTGRLTVGARLLFYPAKDGAAAATPQMVLPISGGPAKLTRDRPRLARDVVLPANLERLALDVLAQGQSHDEFWYTCAPDALASAKDDRCGGGAFREAEVFVDGQRAGFAPLFPWIFTGGINPYLWFPTPAPETLNFSPSRIDLTPFAGLVNDGKPHRVEVGVVGARDYYLVTASLLAWQDEGTTATRGALLINTLAAPQPRIDARAARIVDNRLVGRIDTSARRSGRLSGVLETSRGKVTTTVDYAVSFSNRQDYDADATGEVWNLKQSTRSKTTVQRRDARGVTTWRETLDYPFLATTRDKVTPTGSDQSVAVDLTLNRETREVGPDGRVWSRRLSNRITPTATGRLDKAARRFVDASGSSVQRYKLEDSALGCYARVITVEKNVVVTAQDAIGSACSR